MATAPIPAPVSPEATSSNPGQGGGFPSPAPAQSDPRASQALGICLGAVSSLRAVANQFPTVTAEVRQINDLVAQMLAKIKAGGPPSEPQAPPV